MLFLLNLVLCSLTDWEKPAGFFGSLIYDNSCRGASPAFQPAGWPLRRRRSGGDEIAPPINDIRKRHGAKNAPKDQRTPSRRGCVSAYRGDHRSTVYTYIEIKREDMTSLFIISMSKSLAEFRVRRRESSIICFLPRHVRGRKHFARSERRIVRYLRTTEAQNAAKLSRKRGFATFSTVSL